MPRERHFRQGDVTAAVKAVERAGKSVERVEIDPDGKVIVLVAQPEDQPRRPRNNESVEKFIDALRPQRSARPRKSDAP